MLPALTASRRRLSARRIALGAASALLTLGALGAEIGGAAAPPVQPSLAQSLAPATWAMSLPAAWLAAPVPRVRTGDVIDVLAVRQGDRAYAVPVAYAARVMAADEHGIVLELDEEGASAIAIARGGGLLLVPLLRSAR
ncbi:MAG: hypothetical protein E6I19_08785 [Chloroflexi bacterium]|nr:MAG: hypothetical protein E6I48_05925 [Chloroflexota bacterium]TMF55146.1 MAG: hypothetical protein E6I19_08785 [Chloroflexota bacterium]